MAEMTQTPQPPATERPAGPAAEPVAEPVAETTAAPELAAFRAAVDAALLQEARLFAAVPGAGHLTRQDAPLDPVYYLRHRIEVVHRIRATARSDALALACMLGEDYEAARLWAEYAEEEMNHDRLYLADLERHGLSRARVLGTPPFPATHRLLAYLDRRTAELGSLPAVAYALFVEWNSRQAGPQAVARAAERFGPDCVRGAHAHVEIDQRDDHDEMMYEVAYRVCRARGLATEVLIQLLHDIGQLQRGYFAELHAYAARRRPDSGAALTAAYGAGT